MRIESARAETIFIIGWKLQPMGDEMVRTQTLSCVKADRKVISVNLKG